MGGLRSKLIRLAYDRPELRSELLPLLKESLAPAKCLQNAYDTYMDEHPKSKKKKSDPLFKKKCENSEEKSEDEEKGDTPDNVIQFPGGKNNKVVPEKSEKSEEGETGAFTYDQDGNKIVPEKADKAKEQKTPEEVAKDKKTKEKEDKVKADNERKELLQADKKREEAVDKAYEDDLIAKYKKKYGDDDVAVSKAVKKDMKKYKDKKDKAKKRKDQGVAKTFLEDYKKYKTLTKTWLNPESNPLINEVRNGSERVASRYQARIVARRHRG